jgi:hypothetical protein
VFTVPYELKLLMYFRFVVQLEGRAIAQAVSRQPVAAKARFRSHVSTCEICGGESGTTKDFSPNTSVSSVSIIPSLPQTHLYRHVVLNGKIKGES